ncbi:MAG TPA: acyl-CoA thioesterase [Verrucomicrobia bacterium]|nr:acyl-CoA thioesterase [Verrucomicrobiota bacterium]HOB31999.1 thioesterase family protein [Verrucomicrobiota bacterium]HOP95822.1 thioesterase family protein [Verrucomicrobiota bacterium]HPU56391.1 thioesterase family protein [Verrucomicrobiota bacterium]
MPDVFLHRHRVTYAECTVGNHVYYSRYLDLLEAARGEFFRHIGAPLAELQQQDLIFPVIECRLRYRAPARYDDLLAIELWIAGMQGVRLTFAYRITNAENRLPLVEAETVHVCATCQEKPCRLPGDLAAKLQPYLRASAP